MRFVAMPNKDLFKKATVLSDAQEITGSVTPQNGYQNK